jgi:hypothetical protein
MDGRQNIARPVNYKKKSNRWIPVELGPKRKGKMKLHLTIKVEKNKQTYKYDTRRSVQIDSSACCNGAEDGCATKQKAVQKYYQTKNNKTNISGSVWNWSHNFARSWGSVFPSMRMCLTP